MENNPKNYWDYDSNDNIRVDNRFKDNRKLFNYFFTDIIERFLTYIWGMTRKDIKNY